jgi:hypothetical protein
MMQIALIGIGAGAAAALLFASVTSGSLLSVLLFYLAPLPLMIAALGWSHWAALFGALFGALAMAAIFGSTFFFAFLASAGMPAWWLGYLAMLARPAAAGGNGAAPALEWYPPGRLVMWAAILAALVVLVAILSYGADVDSFRAAMHRDLARLLQIETGEAASKTGASGDNASRLIDFLVTALPPAAAVLATITSVFNLWLAGRIVAFSGRLSRPWPQISAMSFPRPMLAALGIAVVLSFLGGLPGVMAGVVTAGLAMAYGVLGFAVLHALTRDMNGRGFLLGGVYAAVVVLGWPVLALCLLGVVEASIGLRARFAAGRGPPPIQS